MHTHKAQTSGTHWPVHESNISAPTHHKLSYNTFAHNFAWCDGGSYAPHAHHMPGACIHACMHQPPSQPPAPPTHQEQLTCGLLPCVRLAACAWM
mmetsp:Transcript_39416/g.87708  ORF Transcript_39416/g.87708 Transcript_39416/m.87708 type:complete len:95 (-) Transcript_39416:1606-1890(-)